MPEHGFGIIGCGMISEWHAGAIGDLKNAGLIAAAEVNEKSAAKFTEKYGVPCLNDYHDLLKRDDIDIVNICLPSGAQMEPAIAAAEAGKHIVVEKPLEITLERIDRIIEACDRNGVTLSVIFQSRFDEPMILIKKAIDEGRFGTLTLIDCYNKWWRSQEYYDSGGWRADESGYSCR